MVASSCNRVREAPIFGAVCSNRIEAVSAGERIRVAFAEIDASTPMLEIMTSSYDGPG